MYYTINKAYLVLSVSIYIRRFLINLTSITLLLTAIFTTSSFAKDIDYIDNLEFQTLSGSKYYLNDISHDIILLNFWASWCGYCKEEFASMFKLIKESEGKIALIAISVDDKANDATNFLREINFSSKEYPDVFFAWDVGDRISSEYFKIVDIPKTIIITFDHTKKQRIIIDEIAGSIEWNKDVIEPYQ
ncbi:MAG: TlpA family protein disulfide reductase [Rickettsiales bacterium]|nr:TlpA family protein disulfide reductase [Rickettsiales bacterium]